MTPKLKSHRAIGRQVATPPRRAKPLAPRTLAEQQADFTAEGSPPPGTVSGAGPGRLPEER